MNNDSDIKKIRRDYTYANLSRDDLQSNPYDQFNKWFSQSCDEKKILDPNAMILSTVDKNGTPNSRVVLLKSWSKNGFIFFTNYKSVKSKEIDSNNKVSLLFFWESYDRQIRLKGKAEKLNNLENKKYFNSRPFKSKIGSMSSEQSEVIFSRSVVENKFELLSSMYKKTDILEAKSWGGYLVQIDEFEFWQGGENRIHDRFLYKKISKPSDKNMSWTIDRLSP